MTVWCSRCDRFFGQHRSLRQHIQNSNAHWECPVCDFDGHSWDDLLDHCRKQGCRLVCQACDGGQGEHWDNAGFWEHVDEYNVCTECERHFDTPSNLTHHKIVHSEASYECLGCDESYTTYSGMGRIIHLEYGNCNTEIDCLTLNMTAAECPVWSRFIDEDYRYEMLNGEDLQEIYDKAYPYMCPTCGSTFPKLSSLFQHVESPACSQTLYQGVMLRVRRFLQERYG